MMKFSVEIRKQALEIYLRCNSSYTLFYEKWLEMHQDGPFPGRKYMSRLLLKFRETGSVLDRIRKRSRPSRNEENVVFVGAYFQSQLGTSLRGFIKEGHLDISISTLRTILKDDLHFKAYKSRKFHHLNGEDDFIQRYQMSIMFRDYINNDPTFLSKIVWTDECYMKLNGVINSNNVCWWSSENPHIILEKSQNSHAIMVFVGFTRYGPIGPWFSDELSTNLNSSRSNMNSVSGPSFNELLETKVVPQLKEFSPDDQFEQLFF